MSSAIEVRVPNIGDFKDVPIIDVLVKPGDRIALEAPLVTIESEKAAMEIPSPNAGVVESVVVKVGDKVSEGSALITLAAADGGAANGAAAPASQQASSQPGSEEEGAERPPRSEEQPRSGEHTRAEEPARAEEPPRAGARTDDSTESVVEIRVPDIGDFKDVPVIDVLVRAGDRVEKEAPLIVLESDKASMEVPSPNAGVVRDVVLKVGDKVSQGSVIASLAVADGATAKAAARDGQQPAPASPGAAPASASAQAPSTPPSASPAAAARAAEPESGEPAAAETAQAADDGPTEAVHASPSIRRFARELGVDLRRVKGTGPRGRVTREDVQGFVKAALAAPPGRAPGDGAAVLGLAPWPKVDFAQYGPIERVALPRIKRLSGPNLHRNWVMIPHVTNNDEADITDLEAFRQKVNADDPNAKLTILAFAIKAVVAALQRFPDFNSSLDGDQLVLKRYYHIGFAADTPNGLVVPVLRDADKKGVLAIAAQTRELAAKAREGKLTLGEMQGGTFTISSLGGIGGTSFSPIINAPEVAILGLSRSSTQPVWDGHQFLPRLLLPLSLSYDHRVIDGAAAARFNAYLASLLADLRRAVL